MDVTAQVPVEHKKAVEEFHLYRRPFFFFRGELIFNEKNGDTRDHYHWMNEDFGVSLEEYNKSPRGYMIPGKIQFFIGDCFEPVDMRLIDLESFLKILGRYQKNYSHSTVNICNGVKIGELGEIWPPIHKLATIDTSNIEIH